MALLKSMYSAASGLSAQGQAVDVVSDNLANLNTTGYRASRARFDEVLGATVARGRVGGGSGLGAKMGSVDQMFGQGALLSSGVNTDLALKGDGFFAVKGSYDGLDASFYTRAGQFNLSKDGYLLNPQGLRVQGYIANAQGSIGSALTDLQVPAADAVPQPTATVTVAANLAALDPILPAFNPLQFNSTSNFATSMTVYDSLGAGHNVDVFFRKAAAGSFEWFSLVDGGELQGGTPGVPTQIANGTMTFTTNGELDTETTVASSADFLGATPGQVISFDFGDSITTDGGTGLVGTTSYGSPSNTSQITQDGFSTGSLADVSIAEDGRVTGTFTNGERRILAQVAVARFRNNNGLVRAGSGLFIASEQSGNPLVGAAATGGRGSIISEALEGSNVDMAGEFVNLISFQRAFQANSRTVQTADDMLQELVNLKR